MGLPETPFLENNPDCISCGACAYLCPTARIIVIDTGNIREIKKWHKKEEMAECPECKTLFIPKSELLNVKENIDVRHFKVVNKQKLYKSMIVLIHYI